MTIRDLEIKKKKKQTLTTLCGNRPALSRLWIFKESFAQKLRVITDTPVISKRITMSSLHVVLFIDRYIHTQVLFCFYIIYVFNIILYTYMQVNVNMYTYLNIC